MYHKNSSDTDGRNHQKAWVTLLVPAITACLHSSDTCAVEASLQSSNLDATLAARPNAGVHV